jgi:hypothetical protein
MRKSGRKRVISMSFCVVFGVFSAVFAGVMQAQQVVQRGAGGVPSQILDETNQWSVPIAVSESHDVDLYIPDVTSPAWLQKNYRRFMDEHQYVITMVTYYRSPAACRANQAAWGNTDSASMDACSLDISYRVHQLRVDAHLKTITLLMAAMVGHDGSIITSTVQNDRQERTWANLGPNTQVALDKTTRIVAKQMKAYDLRVQTLH